MEKRKTRRSNTKDKFSRLSKENLKEWEKTHSVQDKNMGEDFKNPKSKNGYKNNSNGSDPVESSTLVDTKGKRTSEESKESGNNDSSGKEENKNSSQEEDKEEGTERSSKFPGIRIEFPSISVFNFSVLYPWNTLTNRFT
jgi:hypothetical protein